jgi:hypothetical protein
MSAARSTTSAAASAAVSVAASAAVSVAFEQPTDRAGELAGKPGVVRFLEVAPVRAVMVDGDGQPGEATFGTRMPGLYATAYSLRFALKRRGVERRVGMLEGLYWTVDGSTDLDVILGPDRGTWRWTLFIALPDEATDEELADALAKGRAKVAPDVAADLRLETFAEGAVAQVLHLGPYADERPTIERLHAAIAAAGLRPRGRHHELYLGDPGRSAPAKLRTLVRHPVKPA